MFKNLILTKFKDSVDNKSNKIFIIQLHTITKIHQTISSLTLFISKSIELEGVSDFHHKHF